MSGLSKNLLPIQNLEIKIDSDSSMPRVILNGVDFQAEDIGLQGIKIIWETKKDEVPETLIQVDYINNREAPHIVSVKHLSYQRKLKVLDTDAILQYLAKYLLLILVQISCYTSEFYLHYINFRKEK